MLKWDRQPVDVMVTIGDRRVVNGLLGFSVRMRKGQWAILVGLSVSLAVACSLFAPEAEAQTVSQGTRTAQAVTAEPLVQPARPPRRLRIYPRYYEAEPDGVYPRYNPGPNAVRVCSASYVQEYRPTGTVIVPHTTCVWRRG
jgi:hypothetical protein